jgi:hypothetical protein
VYIFLIDDPRIIDLKMHEEYKALSRPIAEI